MAPRCLFPAFPCESYDEFLKGNCFPCDSTQQDDPEVAAKCGNMGYYADRSTGRGQLYLVTREEEPFCAHQFNIDIFSSENDLPLRTLGRLEAILTGDGTLSETFSITEKDDTEFFAGETMSRILVPHPALGFPHSVTLRYKSYSGWLSKGLAQWTIQKVVLTDSFGAKRSFCRPEISLASERQVFLDLLPGECELPEENTTLDPIDGISTTTSSTSDSTEENRLKDYQYSTSGPYDDDLDRLREKKEIIKLGSSYKISTNRSQSTETDSGFDNKERLPWQPLLENSIDGPNEINPHERSQQETGRSISDLSLSSSTTTKRQHEINEPILKSTTQRTANTVGDVQRPRDNSYFTIQLLPFRLGELIERAERYARETLFPFFSDAPRIFGLSPATSTSSTDRAQRSAFKTNRQPKYFPSLGELTFGGNSQSSETSRSQRRVDLPPPLSPTITVEQPDFVYDSSSPTTTSHPESSEELVAIDESRSSKNLLTLIHQQDSEPESRSDAPLALPPPDRYYISDLDALAGPNPVHIGLPTYAPTPRTTVSPNQFPYKFELNTDEPKVSTFPLK